MIFKELHFFWFHLIGFNIKTKVTYSVTYIEPKFFTTLVTI